MCKLTEIASKHPSNKNKKDKTTFSFEAFKDDLEKSLTNFMTFLPEITINNFNSEFAKFVDIFKSAVDNHAPFKLLSRRQSKFMLKPWITKGIKIFIQKKQKMYIILKETKLPDSSSFNKFLHDRVVDSIFLQPTVPT